MKIKVHTMTTSRGNSAKDQFEIWTDTGVYFQSYSSIIAFTSFEDGTTLDEDYWDYSVTTGRYRNIFLGEGIAETRAKIKSGEYTLGSLN